MGEPLTSVVKAFTPIPMPCCGLPCLTCADFRVWRTVDHAEGRGVEAGRLEEHGGRVHDQRAPVTRVEDSQGQERENSH